MKRILKKRLNNKGFTLVELVVVIAILGILAAISVPQLLGYTNRAKEQADRQTAVQVRNAVALLYANGEISSSSDVDKNTITVVGDGTNKGVVQLGANVAGNAGAIQAMVAGGTEDAPNEIEVVGKSNIVITLGTDGEVKIIAPTGIS